VTFQRSTKAGSTTIG